MPSLGSYGPAKEPVWTRTRWFIGHRQRAGVSGGRLYDKVIFPCRYTPTYETHGREFGYVTGPYRSKREAYAHIGY